MSERPVLAQPGSWAANRRWLGSPNGAPIRCGTRELITTALLSASTTYMSRLAGPAVSLRKLSSVTSKWTIAGLDRSIVGIGVLFAMTQSNVSGDTYGRLW